MNIDVSVIICTFNRRNLVPRAIESVLSQEDVKLQVVVVDDCSVDGTFEFLKEQYGHKVSIIKTLRNSGVSTSTNLGSRIAIGKFIALLGDDDYWEDRRKLAKQLNKMRKTPSLGLTGTWWTELRIDNQRLVKNPKLHKNRYLMIEKLLMGGGVVCGSTALISRRAWDSVNGMDERHVKGTDSDLFRRIALAGYGVEVINELTTIVDVSHGLMRMTPAENISSLKRSLNANTRVLKKHWLIYLIYPRALAMRVRKIVLLIIKLLIKIIKQII
ncbi:MAG: glycosyltransferase [Opitutaceae bacterium]|nr:glycosyltransferase [Opitutaceae bacterium]